MWRFETASSCRWVRTRLTLLVDGELPMDQRRPVERHVLECADCRARLDSARRAVSALKAVSADVLGPSSNADSVWPGLRQQIREARRSGVGAVELPSWSFGLGPQLGLIGGLGLLVAVLIALRPEVAPRAAGHRDKTPMLTEAHPRMSAEEPPKSSAEFVAGRTPTGEREKEPVTTAPIEAESTADVKNTY